MTLIIDADSMAEIDSALALARDYKLKIIISGGAEAWLTADRLAAANVPVLTGAMNNIPGKLCHAQSTARERRAAAQGRRESRARRQRTVTRAHSTRATSSTKPATPSRTACLTTMLCAP
jgi:hypothetical protein